MRITWETIEQDHDFFLYRTLIPGGWLMLMVGGPEQVSLTFVPDPDHQWNGKP